MGRVAATGLAVLVWVLLGQVPLPILDLEVVASSELPMELTSLRALGTWPFLWGFLLVEGLSMLLPHGRAQVRGGMAARTRLTRASVLVSLMLVAVQAYGVGTALLQIRYGNQPIVDPAMSPALFVPLTVGTLTAVGALVVMLTPFTVWRQARVPTGATTMTMVNVVWVGAALVAASVMARPPRRVGGLGAPSAEVYDTRRQRIRVVARTSVVALVAGAAALAAAGEQLSV